MRYVLWFVISIKISARPSGSFEQKADPLDGTGEKGNARDLIQEVGRGREKAGYRQKQGGMTCAIGKDTIHRYHLDRGSDLLAREFRHRPI
jgi:hypothetical protein